MEKQLNINKEFDLKAFVYGLNYGVWIIPINTDKKGVRK